MELHLLPIFALLCLVLVGSNASTPAEDYWHSLLPDTPIPSAIQDLLQIDAGIESPEAKKFSQIKKAFPLLYSSGENHQELLYVKKAFPLLYSSGENHQKLLYVKKAFPLLYYCTENDQKLSDIKKAFPLLYSSTENGQKLPHDQKLSDIKKAFPLLFSSTENGQKLVDIKKAFPLLYSSTENGRKSSNIKKAFPLLYDSAKNRQKPADNTDVAKNDLTKRTLFYKYNDIHPGQKMTLLFDIEGNGAPFLSREVAQSIPFSSEKLEEILAIFSIDTNSPEASIVADTIKDCEDPKLKGEDKFCATSLESLVDQTVAKLGKNIQVLSTPLAKRQEYTILPGIKMIANDRISICHRQSYTYAIYHCHRNVETEVHSVPILGADGTRMNALTICHRDTSGWNQGHIAFEILKIEKPGPPVCHFLPYDALVWFPASLVGHESV